MKNKLLIITALTLATTWGNAAGADELVVIVNPDIEGSITKNDVARIFLGKSTQFPSGENAVPVEIDSSHPNYEIFAREVLRKTPAQLRAYWAKQVFTGRSLPPKKRKDQEQLRQLVAENKHYLSYIDESKKNDRVRVVLEVLE